MTEKYIMLNLDDEKTGKISEVLASKVCKKIINELAERDLSESDLAEKLKMPLNTLEYNLKKLIDVGLVEKGKEHFWSKKGKKIPVYKAVRKSIIISPKMSNTLKGILATGLISSIAAVGIKIYYRGNEMLNVVNGVNSVNTAQDYAMKVGEVASSGVASSAPGVSSASGAGALNPVTAVQIGNQVVPLVSSNWLWFLAGALFALVILLLINWKKL